MEKELEIKNKHLQEVAKGLNNLLKVKRNALPKDFNETRFLQNCMTVLQDTKDIEKCTPISIARTMIKGAFLGLDFFNRECYIIPYNKNIGTKNSPEWIKEAQFMTDYKGERKIALKHSVKKVKDIYAKLVKEGEVLEVGIKDGKQFLNFQEDPFCNGKVLGAFAVVIYEDGTINYEIMNKKEILQIRDTFSKAKNSTAWLNTEGEMFKKTVLRRLCKNIDLDFDIHEQQEAFIDGMASDVNKKEEPPKIENPFKNDLDFEEVNKVCPYCGHNHEQYVSKCVKCNKSF